MSGTPLTSRMITNSRNREGMGQSTALYGMQPDIVVLAHNPLTMTKPGNPGATPHSAWASC